MMLETLEPREMLAITAGAGPGGVIPEGPASDVVLWVKADTLGLADGANVDAWADQSGRGNDLGNRQNTVTYIAADPDFNSQPSVQFGNGIAGDGGAGNATRLAGVTCSAHQWYASRNDVGAQHASPYKYERRSKQRRLHADWVEQ